MEPGICVENLTFGYATTPLHFQSRLVTAGTVLLFAGAAYIVAQISLHYLEVNIPHNLHRIAALPAAVFKKRSDRQCLLQPTIEVN